MHETILAVGAGGTFAGLVGRGSRTLRAFVEDLAAGSGDTPLA